MAVAFQHTWNLPSFFFFRSALPDKCCQALPRTDEGIPLRHLSFTWLHDYKVHQSKLSFMLLIIFLKKPKKPDNFSISYVLWRDLLEIKFEISKQIRKCACVLFWNQAYYFKQNCTPLGSNWPLRTFWSSIYPSHQTCAPISTLVVL